MQFLATFHALDFLDSVVSLVVAFVLGTAIGAERQYRQRTAGLRTNVLVAVGACQFVDMGIHLGGADSAVRIIANVVTGIGFLGAGVIMKEGTNIRGLNTAATLWCSAAVGACAGADLVAQAVLLTVFVLAGNTMLRPLIDALERLPRDEAATEATYEVGIVVPAAGAPEAQGILVARLDAAQFPVDDIETLERAEGRTELRATLVNTSVRPRELDAVIAELKRMPGILAANWTRSGSD
ncbi:MgtC/SapB family protein [Starkeya sp. ORNL1]|uniref:MgtC/SapB family protein n=1 Tax=Starkeya sp. ORNL1 TaxID=2709380 RepID=UPI0014630F00|nr:MgtC/SapB family protein [Starkeya sp. ORNL1]QJP12541.1 MgtC/SapB family protein [Starkeya sp. ORNL1]